MVNFYRGRAPSMLFFFSGFVPVVKNTHKVIVFVPEQNAPPRSLSSLGSAVSNVVLKLLIGTVRKIASVDVVSRFESTSTVKVYHWDGTPECYLLPIPLGWNDFARCKNMSRP